MSTGQIRLPSTWTSPLDSFARHSLTPGTPEFEEVKDQFKKTIGAKGVTVLEVGL